MGSAYRLGRHDDRHAERSASSRRAGPRPPPGRSPAGVHGGQGRGPATRRPTCCSSAPTTCWRPTPSTSSGPSGRRHAPTVIDRLRLTPAARRGHGGRAAHGGGAGRPGRRDHRRLGAPERPAHPPGAGAARRGRHHLREPAQRHQRRRRAVRQAGNVAFLRGSSGAITSNLAIAAVLREGVAKAGLPERRRRAGGGHRPRVRRRVHAAARRDRLPGPAGRAVADRVDPRARHGAVRDRR